MKRIDTVVVGAGQAGLALSRCLIDRGIEHVVLERDRVGARWSERWDSLRLLSPNWMTRLPGWSYRGTDPDGFMSRDEVTAFLTVYARSFGAPVREQTTVVRVDRATSGWRVVTDRGTWLARHVVVATGHCQHTRVPAVAGAVPRAIVQVTAAAYRRPSQLPDGGVLVVGASASGLQLADELAQSGRPVVLAVGRHTRLPRRYRGQDIMDWLDRIGSLTRLRSELPHPEEAPREPSMQLVGSNPPATLDLTVLAGKGVELAGRLVGFDGARARFAGDLARTTGEADARMHQLLARIDRHIEDQRLTNALPVPAPFGGVDARLAHHELHLQAAGIRTIVWATGYARSYPWLHAPVLDESGEIRHVRGHTALPGLYVLGLQFMIRRNSSLIDGVGRDAQEIAAAIARRAQWRCMEAA
jgi:putative flavoprotein involved in K+ transport